ncbi:hypothetical protein HGC74_001686 [Campylobacter coli]|nr:MULTISPECIES: hypothetical protein [Campylobacter]APA57621.1 hypothetical protein BLD33_03870 [Campylobacter coli]EAH7482892.1 hypothetical protein [Campylobacter coli]EAH8786992.1 hypothetical protein [Campylobacter coli]EAI3440678.1 hypothetical protein [Campylobacter coli]EAI3509530.1 hypothetical protein [Campylobacter coli]
MAFYNPQRVVFNPDTGVIQNAGKVGGVLYDIMSKSFDDKVKANEFQQEQDLRKQQMEFNQAMQNNQLLQNERNFDYQKERANIADQQWQMNYNQRARQYAMQNALRQQAINAREQKDEILADQAILNLPSYTKSNPEMRAIQERFNTIKKGGGDSYYDGQGLLGGTWQNIKGLFGGDNINDAQDSLFKFISDSIYNEKVRRDTNYNRTRHDEIYKEPSAWKAQTINAKEYEKAIRDYIATSEAKINAYYDEQMAKISNLKNPYINNLYEEQRQKDLKDFREGLAKDLESYYIKDEISNKPSKNAVIIDNSTTNQNIQEVQNQNTPKLHSVSFNGINAQISEPDANGNVILVNQAGRKMQVSVEELKKQGLIQ